MKLLSIILILSIFNFANAQDAVFERTLNCKIQGNNQKYQAIVTAFNMVPSWPLSSSQGAGQVIIKNEVGEIFYEAELGFTYSNRATRYGSFYSVGASNVYGDKFSYSSKSYDFDNSPDIKTLSLTIASHPELICK